MDALHDTDVLYVTRIQRERFESQEEYEKVSHPFDSIKYKVPMRTTVDSWQLQTTFS